jgi:exodeoxyribonuclease X
MLFRVVDVETTGVDPENDALVEIACVDVCDESLSDIRHSLIKPPIPIPPIASAVHHITDLDVAGAPPAREVVPEILFPEEPAIYVAHNSIFECEFLKSYIPGASWLCTFKGAKRVWPDLLGYKNQELRYQLQLPCERNIANQSHRAGPDAYVTAHLLCRLLREVSVEDLLRWTTEPVYMPRCPIGKDKGFLDKPWSEVETGFLRWMIDKPIDNADAIWWADQELKRRSAEADQRISARLEAEKAKRDGYMVGARAALKLARTPEDLKKWWLDEEPHRIEHRITQGTPEYATLVSECAAHKATLLETAT